MNPTMTRLSNMTVAQLREIGREMRINGLSKCRKAELVVALACFIDGEHATALIANEMHEPTMRMVKAAERMATPYKGERTIAAIKAEGIVSHMDFPYAEGNVITDAHVKICAQRGHGYYIVDGKYMGVCSRCGESTMDDLHMWALNMDAERTGFLRDESEAHNTNECIDVANDKGYALKLTNYPYQYAIRRNGIEVESFDTLREVRHFLNLPAFGYVHTCAHWQVEVGLSECAYGCKIYRCSQCGKGGAVLHNATYGCKG